MARAICGHFRHLASAQMKLKDIQRRQSFPAQAESGCGQALEQQILYGKETEQRHAITECFNDSSSHHLGPEQ